MFKRKMILLSLLIIGLLAFSSVCAGDVNETVVASDGQSDDLITVEYNNEIVTLNNQNDENISVDENDEIVDVMEDNEIGATTGTFTDLANDIANAKGELNLTKNYAFSSVDSKYSEGIPINKSITINGNRFNIDTGDNPILFKISANNVTLKDISFKKPATDGGSLIIWRGNNGIISDCIFTRCVNNILSCYGKNIIMNGCNFNDCYSNYGMSDQAIFWSGDNGSITNCNFNNYISSCIGDWGGYCDGGVINFISTGGNITDSNFINCVMKYNENYGTYLGGAVAFKGYYLSGCTFINCSSQKGGAVYIYYNIKSNTLIMNNSFHDCSAEYGGACQLWGSRTINENNKYGRVKFINNVFNHCSSEYDGGATMVDVYVSDEDISDVICSFENCLFEYNVAKNCGGGLSSNVWTAKIGIDVNDFNPLLIDINNCNFTNNSATNGGSIYVMHPQLNIFYSNFINNTASNGGAICWNSTNAVIDSSCFYNNVANNDGGAIFINGDNGVFTSIILRDNEAKNDGGIFWKGNSGEIKDSILLSDGISSVIYSDNMINANYNWWGNTNENYSQKPFTPTQLKVKNWLYLNVSSNENTLNIGDIAIIKYDLTNLYSNNDVISKYYYAFNLPNIDLTVNIEGVNKTITLVGGLGEVKYIVGCSNSSDDVNSSGNSNQTNNNSKPINDGQITISPLNAGYGTIKLPSDASGTITLDIAGQKYKFPVVNGVANVKLPDLANGNYGYIITYSGDTKYSSFLKTGSVTINKQTPTTPVAKTTITLKTVKVKKSAKKLVLQATLKQGKTPLKNKKITFKFNGKTYKAKTNKKGIAKIIIKNSVLKKLKVGKKIKYQASYGKILAKKTAKVKK